MCTLGGGVETNGTLMKFDGIHPSVFPLLAQRKFSSPQGEPWRFSTHVGTGLPDGPEQGSTGNPTEGPTGKASSNNSYLTPFSLSLQGEKWDWTVEQTFAIMEK